MVTAHVRPTASSGATAYGAFNGRLDLGWIGASVWGLRAEAESEWARGATWQPTTSSCYLARIIRARLGVVPGRPWIRTKQLSEGLKVTSEKPVLLGLQLVAA